jgi:hypothetical protein
MTIIEILEKAIKAGVRVSEKVNEPGHFVLLKNGMSVVEVFSLAGKSVVVFDANGRYPKQVSAEDWTDILFPN